MATGLLGCSGSLLANQNEAFERHRGLWIHYCALYIPKLDSIVAVIVNLTEQFSSYLRNGRVDR